MYVEKHAVALTTDASGDATGYTPVITGAIAEIIYEKDDFANGVDFNITVEGTGETVWAENDVNADATRAPRQPTHGTDGTASLYAASGEPVEDYIVVAQDRVKIVVSNGGNAKSGTFYVLVV